MQCLHCGVNVCLECAQKHAELVANENHTITDLMNEKLDVLDRIAERTREKIRIEREKIVQGIDSEYERSLAALNELVEKEKKQLRDKNKQLTEMSFNEIPTFVQNLKTDLQSMTDDNEQFFSINTTMPRIEIQRTPKPISYSFPENQQSTAAAAAAQSKAVTSYDDSSDDNYYYGDDPYYD